MKELVSFVIPTLNNISTIEQCLNSIVSQDYPNIELIVVDGGSRDGTYDVAKKYADKIIVQKGMPAVGRQVGIRASNGNILGLFDSDVYLPNKGWLKKALGHFNLDKSVGVVWPINIPPKDSSSISRCYFSFWRVRAMRDDVLPGTNSLISRRAFEKVGGFDTSLLVGDDFDLCYRVIRAGYKVVRHMDPIIHDSMRSLREFTMKEIVRAPTTLSYGKDTYANMLYLSMTWKPNFGKRTDPVKCSLNYLRFALTTISGSGGNDYANLLIFLLMAIRITVYGFYHLKRLVKGI